MSIHQRFAAGMAQKLTKKKENGHRNRLLRAQPTILDYQTNEE